MKKSVLIALMIMLAISAHYRPAGCAVLLDRVVATVNDEVITWSELMSVIALEGKTYLKESTGEEREKKIEELQRPFLENLINARLQLQEARKMGLQVSEAEVDAAIDEIMNKYDMSDEILQKSLEREGLTLRDYRERLRDQILLQKAVNTAVTGSVVVSDAEIKEFYEKNKEQFGEKEKVRIQQIFFPEPESAAARKEIEAKAREILDRISSGADFGELAREMTGDSGMQFSGDLGYISRGSMLKDVEEAAFSLDTGEVSGPVWSSAGLHIIKVVDRMEGGSFEKVRDRIKEMIFQKKYQAKYHEWLTGLRETAYIEKKL